MLNYYFKIWRIGLILRKFKSNIILTYVMRVIVKIKKEMYKVSLDNLEKVYS